MIACFLTAPAAGDPSAREPDRQQRVTLAVKSEPMEAAFRQLIAQTGFNYIYSPSIMEGLRVEGLRIEGATLEEALRRLFRSTDIEWAITGDNIILRRRAPAPKGYAWKHPTPSAQLTVSGFVREATTGEAIIGALVVDSLSRQSTVTNRSGFYTLNVGDGSAARPSAAMLVVSYPGFTRAISERFDPSAQQRIDFDMQFDNQLAEVVVTAPTFHPLTSAEVGLTRMDRRRISRAPMALGEPDVVKSIQLLPGVSSGIEGLAGMYVHGGNNDENLYVIDNVPLYQVNHLGGLFSAFNNAVVRNVDFYKTSFPARYNGRLSSVIDVTNKEGSLTEHHGSLRLGLASGAFDIDGPIIKGRTSYSFALRRTWYDLLAIPALAIVNAANSSDGHKTHVGYSFTDLNAKITHRLASHTKIYASLYWGEDRLKGGETNGLTDSLTRIDRSREMAHMRWGNLVGSLGLEQAITERLFGRLIGSFNHYASTLRRDSRDRFGRDTLEIDNSYHYRMANHITDWGVRADLEWNASRRQSVEAGVAFTLHRFTPRDCSTLIASRDGTDEIFTSWRTSASAAETMIYISDSWAITPKLRLNTGLNAGFFAINGHTHWGLDPRASLRWLVARRVALKASFARMSQYVHQLTESSISLPTDQWVPIDGSFKPQRSDHAAIGGVVQIGKRLTLELEGYYKRMHNLIDYRTDFYLVPETASWYERLCSGRGSAKGIDFQLTRTSGMLTGHIGYSLLWTDRRFADRNGGRPYPARFDNRHKINLLLQLRLGSRWELAASWIGMSGNLISLSTQDYDLLDTPDLPTLGNAPSQGRLDLPGAINNYRLPFYHRLDLSAQLRTQRGFWTFSLYNAYCHMNTIVIRKHREPSMSDDAGDTFQKLRILPIIPSVAYTWTF